MTTKRIVLILLRLPHCTYYLHYLAIAEICSSLRCVIFTIMITHWVTAVLITYQIADLARNVSDTTLSRRVLVFHSMISSDPVNQVAMLVADDLALTRSTTSTTASRI